MTTKRLLLTVLCVLGLGNTASAEWEVAGKTNDFTHYVDRNTIQHKEGNIVTMWLMFDYASTQTLADGTRFLSKKLHREYDCSREDMRILEQTNYSGQMGDGASVFRNTGENEQWKAIVPHTVSETKSKIACGKQ